VKQSESNSLRRELARDQQGEPHPDSDVLTALSEGALLQGERRQVLAHLAGCADCREVLSIVAATALESADDLRPFLMARPSSSTQRTWLPWASIAAGLLVVCSAVLVYQQKVAFPKNTAVATREAVRPPSSMLQQSSPLPQLTKPEALSTTANGPRSGQLQAPSPSQNMTVANAIPQATIDAAKRSDLNQQSSYQANAEAGEFATSGATALKAAPARSVSAFAGTEPVRGPSRVPIAPTARPHWRINGLGQPERSFGDGDWQAVLPHEQSRMRVVSVFGSEVWIGGDSSHLYHSADNGVTWNLIDLPRKDGREHSIAHIHFQTTQSGTVESDDGTVWTTSNGGSTWN
jgi:hypothetical protein